MKKIFLIFLPLTSFIFAAFISSLLFFSIEINPVLAQEDKCSNVSSLGLEEIGKCLDELSRAKEQSEKATKPLEDQLSGIKNRVVFIEKDLIVKGEDIKKGYKALEARQEILNRSIRRLYIKNYQDSPLAIFLSLNSAFDITQALAYDRAQTNQDKSVITNIVLSLGDLENKKSNLESEQKELVVVKEKLDKVVLDAKSYQASLSGKIAQLSAKQQEIINSRSGSFTATIGDSSEADDSNASINGFRASAPSGYFGVFSFGAYTHRKGMSQYGARGRAIQNQKYNDILQAYYGKQPVTKDTSGDIQVDGFGSMSFEDKYLMGIAEMPSTWPTEALKAQAVAARTYAYRYKTQGSSICTTEACQVYNDGKANNPPDAWKQAVLDTKGQVLEDVVTYYASTHGGFASPIGWDTTDGNGGSSFIDKAYDKVGGSPWLYKAWYTQSYSINSDKCGRSNAWLNPQEMADIANATIALKTGGIDTSRITPISTSCWGGNPYSMDELKNLVAGNGGISSANSVSVSQGNGSTSSVTINGITFDGSEFKKAFNLRAPGRLSIPQSGFAFFNIEKK